MKESDVELDVVVGDEEELSRKSSNDDDAEDDGSKATKGFRLPWQGVPFFARDTGV